MTSPYTPEKMQERFEELKAKIEKIESTSPRIERDEKIANLTDNQKKDFKRRIKQHEEGLFELKQEYALLARTLGAKSLKAGG